MVRRGIGSEIVLRRDGLWIRRCKAGRPRRQNGTTAMSEKSCGNCWYFASSRSCYDQPIWGHCTWPAPDDDEKAGPNGRFTWTDDTCEHFRARQEVTA